MSFFLVNAKPKRDRLGALAEHLRTGHFLGLRPFGRVLAHSLSRARQRHDGRVLWEQEDYSTPPLSEMRAGVLDDYFDDLWLEPVAQGEGWKRIQGLPPLFPALAGGLSPGA